jgi:hypothetical protein
MKKLRCPSCGAENQQDDSFCGDCGANLPGPTPVKPAQPSPIEPVTPVPALQGLQGQEPAMAAKAKLVVSRTGRVGHEFAIDQEEMNIGRWDADKGFFPDIDLTNDDPGNYISRRHARVCLRGGEYYVEDMGSMNGTFVNKGPRLSPNSPLKLHTGDEIIIGRTGLTFVIK